MEEDKNSPLLFEIAWEVCNKIGGIYTVVKSKASAMVSRWGADYFLIGPYNPDTAPIEFEAVQPGGAIAEALEVLENSGIKTYFGRWLIEGRPYVILFDVRGRFYSLGEDRYFLWKDHGLSLPANDPELDNSIAFGFTVCEFFRALTAASKNRPMIAHFHEWMAGVGIPRIKHFQLPVATVFTTHATLLGRYIAGGNPRFYEELDAMNPHYSAICFNIEGRFLVECCAAQGADFLTTISEVTAREVEKFLGRKPDFLLPNGLNVKRFIALHEFQNLHLKYKNQIHEFVMGHFFPSYTFDLDRTLYFFTSGRYEYRNKGMDLFIEALYRLNVKLQELPDAPTVVAFVITNAMTRSINVGALQLSAMFEDLRKICGELESVIGSKILESVANGQFPDFDELLPNSFRLRLKRAMYARRTDALPGIVTHDLVDDAGDAILQHLRHRNLFNAASDRVKVVYHPEFLRETSPLFNVDYDHFVRGCHLGVFPSYYEPWGYTPLECLAHGIPTVTTDLSGFGAFVEKSVQDIAENGVHVLKRAGKSPDETIEELALYLFRFCQRTRRERIEIRNRAERLSESFDWMKLGHYYQEVHDAALEKLKGQW